MNIKEKILRLISPIIYLKYRYPITGKYYKGLDQIINSLLIYNPNIIFKNIDNNITLLFGKFELACDLEHNRYTIYGIENELEALSAWDKNMSYRVEYSPLVDPKIFREERPSLYNLNRIHKLYGAFKKSFDREIEKAQKKNKKERLEEDFKYARNLFLR